MLVLVALALAIFVLPSPWGLVAIAVAAVVDIIETGLFIWWSTATVGVDSLVGKVGVASSNLWPEGQVKISGELWQARCAGGCDAGTRVVIRAVEGLTLVVDPA